MPAPRSRKIADPDQFDGIDILVLCPLAGDGGARRQPRRCPRRGRGRRPLDRRRGKRHAAARARRHRPRDRAQPASAAGRAGRPPASASRRSTTSSRSRAVDLARDDVRINALVAGVTAELGASDRRRAGDHARRRPRPHPERPVRRRRGARPCARLSRPRQRQLRDRRDAHRRRRLGRVGAAPRRGAGMSALPFPYDFTGQVAVVTGGARGFGFEFARALAVRGATADPRRSRRGHRAALPPRRFAPRATGPTS